jgi:pimeloyl-ACP methyl ester carboxylesterase
LPVASALEARDREALVPSLLGIADAPAPRWRRGVEAVRSAAAGIGRPVVLVGHSGAGPLLPSIADALSAQVAALIFVDASLPPASGLAPLVPAGFVDQLRAIATDGVLPPWSSWFGQDAMRDLVPDGALREVLEQEMPRMPLGYFEDSVPVPEGWIERPCAFLLLTEAYGESIADSRARGWPVAEVTDVQHLAPATDPIPVTDALLDLERALVESG